MQEGKRGKAKEEIIIPKSAPRENGVFAFHSFEAFDNDLALMALHSFSSRIAQVAFKIVRAAERPLATASSV